MKEEVLFDILQNAMPNYLKFVNPYIDNATIPNGDFATMNILNIQDVGRSQEKQEDYDDTKVYIKYTQTRIYTVQLDFYGKNSLDNCNTFRQTLQVNLDRLSHIGESKVGLKTMSNTRNLTDLLDDKRFLRRYSFDVELFVIDKITAEKYYIKEINTILKHY